MSTATSMSIFASATPAGCLGTPRKQRPRPSRSRCGKGLPPMMPTEDALGIGEELGRRFGLPLWQVAMTATEANRYVIRICRTLTGRPKVLSMNECYHGSLDETLPHIGADGKLELRSDYDINPGLPKDLLSRVVEFNDVEALERELAHEDCACVLTEP